MQRVDITKKVKALNLPPREFVIIAGGAMAVRGLKETNDIDMVVSEAVYQQLKAEGWEENTYSDGQPYLTNDVFEAMLAWHSQDSEPNLDQLLRRSELIDGMQVVDLDTVLEWKRTVNRDKDQNDIKILEAHQGQDQG